MTPIEQRRFRPPPSSANEVFCRWQLCLTLFYFGITACGGGGSSGTPVVSEPPPDESAPPPVNPGPSPATGVFLDSPVINIGYRTDTLEGITSSLGEYEYLPGETVTCFIVNLEFPHVQASGKVTALDIAGTAITSRQ